MMTKVLVFSDSFVSEFGVSPSLIGRQIPSLVPSSSSSFLFYIVIRVNTTSKPNICSLQRRQRRGNGNVNDLTGGVWLILHTSDSRLVAIEAEEIEQCQGGGGGDEEIMIIMFIKKSHLP